MMIACVSVWVSIRKPAATFVSRNASSAFFLSPSGSIAPAIACSFRVGPPRKPLLVLEHCAEKALSAVEVVLHEREAGRAAGGNVLAARHIDSNPNRYEEDVDGLEDRDSQEWREVPLRCAEQERREVVAERTVRRQAEHETGRVFAGEGRERFGDRRRNQTGRRHCEKQRTSPQNKALTRGSPRRAANRR